MAAEQKKESSRLGKIEPRPSPQGSPLPASGQQPLSGMVAVAPAMKPIAAANPMRGSKIVPPLAKPLTPLKIHADDLRRDVPGDSTSPLTSPSRTDAESAHLPPAPEQPLSARRALPLQLPPPPVTTASSLPRSDLALSGNIASVPAALPPPPLVSPLPSAARRPPEIARPVSPPPQPLSTATPASPRRAKPIIPATASTSAAEGDSSGEHRVGQRGLGLAGAWRQGTPTRGDAERERDALAADCATLRAEREQLGTETPMLRATITKMNNDVQSCVDQCAAVAAGNESLVRELDRLCVERDALQRALADLTASAAAAMYAGGNAASMSAAAAAAAARSVRLLSPRGGDPPAGANGVPGRAPAASATGALVHNPNEPLSRKVGFW